VRGVKTAETGLNRAKMGKISTISEEICGKRPFSVDFARSQAAL
jgi:hypothetical protein